MRRHLVFWGKLATVATVVVTISWSFALVAAEDIGLALVRKPEHVAWQKDLALAHEQSLVSGKPMLIYFEAKWCGYCRKLKSETLDTPELAQTINQSFIPLTVDLEAEPRIARVLEVKSVPCTVVLSPRADLLGRLVGYARPDAYQSALNRALDLHKKVEREFYSSQVQH